MSSVLLFQYKHLFVHIGQTNHSHSDALLESVDIREIYDKFPEKKGGLKELFTNGQQNSFFLVKFWVSLGHEADSCRWALACSTAHTASVPQGHKQL